MPHDGDVCHFGRDRVPTDVGVRGQNRQVWSAADVRRPIFLWCTTWCA